MIVVWGVFLSRATCSVKYQNSRHSQSCRNSVALLYFCDIVRGWSLSRHVKPLKVPGVGPTLDSAQRIQNWRGSLGAAHTLVGGGHSDFGSLFGSFFRGLGEAHVCPLYSPPPPDPRLGPVLAYHYTMQIRLARPVRGGGGCRGRTAPPPSRCPLKKPTHAHNNNDPKYRKGRPIEYCIGL